MRHSVRLVLQQLLKDDFEVFQNRDLIGIDLDYLFLDGSHFKMHDGTNAEPVMVAYAITTVSQPVLVAAEPTATETQHRIDAFADRHHASLPSCGALPARRPSSADLVPTIPDRAPQTYPTHQPHRTDLRRNPTTCESHRRAGEDCATPQPSPDTSPTSATNSTDLPPRRSQPPQPPTTPPQPPPRMTNRNQRLGPSYTKPGTPP